MSCDKLVFDLSQEVEGSPNVFIRKDWINMLDNQNQNYQNNQSVIDTSQIANSNKYIAYREGYLSIPLTLTIVTSKLLADNNKFQLAPLGTGVGTSDYSIGLKNWFGQCIHSFQIDYNGTTIVQQTNFINTWNSFKLMTTLCWNDIITMGPTIGFYPDTFDSSLYMNAASNIGINLCNNELGNSENSIGSFNSSQGSIRTNTVIAGGIVSSNAGGGNYGLTKRISWINYNPDIIPSTDNANAIADALAYKSFGVASQSLTQIYKSHIFKQTNATTALGGSMQIAVMATVYLKHIHSFFNMVPLLKGAFMKMTLNLNNTTSILTITQPATAANGTSIGVVKSYDTINFVGGVNPLMIPSGTTGSNNLFNFKATTAIAAAYDRFIYYNISVGSTVTDSSVTTFANAQGANLSASPLSKSIYLYVPAYTFNPTFEQAYISNNIKQIKYTDVYYYPVKAISAGAAFNNLVTNGIANIKSVLIVPLYSKNSAGVPYAQYQSPFDPAGTTATAPLVPLGNFNIQVCGQNAIYNMQRYSFEEWNNQLYGQNAVNGGLTDGLTSGLIDFNAFQNNACYYYVNVERMLPVEQSVPKSIQVLGQNYSARELDLMVFVEYGVSMAFDVLTGSRV